MGDTRTEPIADDLRERLTRVIERLPGPDGGSLVILATAGVPPAISLLSTAEVHVTDDVVRVAVYRGSSVVDRLGTAFALVVDGGPDVLRVEIIDASCRDIGNLVVIEGSLFDIRPTAEPPWEAVLRFQLGDDPSGVPDISHWRSVKEWLRSGATSEFQPK